MRFESVWAVYFSACGSTRRVLRARGELVCTTMSSRTGLLQAVTMACSPSTSTQHTRQAAISLMPFK